MGYVKGRLGSSTGLNPNQNLSGPTWDWIMSAAKASGKKAADYCKENPEECIGVAKDAYGRLTSKPVEIPNVYGGLNTSVAGGYNVSPSVSAVWVRSSPFSDSKTTEITSLDSGQGLHVVGATNQKPEWFYIDVPLKGYIYSGNLVSVGSTPKPHLAPGETLMTEEEFWANYDKHQAKRGGMGALIPVALAVALLNQ